MVALAAAVGALATGCSGGDSGGDNSTADRVTVMGSDAGGSPVATATAAAGSPSAAPEAAGSGVPVCAEIADWGTSLKESASYTGAEVYGVRSGQHDCYDRVVFDVNGADPVGYHVRYVEGVHADDPWQVGQTLLDPRGWQALDSVTFAGSFEGQTTFAVGVDARAPFRVHTLPDDAVTHVVLDIAHGQD